MTPEEVEALCRKVLGRQPEKTAGAIEVELIAYKDRQIAAMAKCVDLLEQRVAVLQATVDALRQAAAV